MEDCVPSCWSTIGEHNEEDDGADESLLEPENNLDPMKLSQELDSVLDDLKMRLQDQDLQLRSGVIQEDENITLKCLDGIHMFDSLHGGNSDEHPRWRCEKRKTLTSSSNSNRQTEVWHKGEW